MNESGLSMMTLSDQDYWSFLGMDEQRVKDAFKEWVYRLCQRNDWLDSSGAIIQIRVAEYFGISRQVVANWLNGTSFISSKMVTETICPRMGILPSKFWEQMQLIDTHLRGDVSVLDETDIMADNKPATADDVLSLLDRLPSDQKAAFRKRFLLSLAEA